MQKLFRSAIKLERFTIVPNSLLLFYLKCSTLLAPMTHMSRLCATVSRRRTAMSRSQFSAGVVPPRYPRTPSKKARRKGSFYLHPSKKVDQFAPRQDFGSTRSAASVPCVRGAAGRVSLRLRHRPALQIHFSTGTSQTFKFPSLNVAMGLALRLFPQAQLCFGWQWLLSLTGN